MITMDLISHDISLHCYMVTDVIEIHLLEPGVVFHSITGAPPGGRAEMAKKKKKSRENCNENKETCSLLGSGASAALAFSLEEFGKGHIRSAGRWVSQVETLCFGFRKEGPVPRT